LTGLRGLRRRVVVTSALGLTRSLETGDCATRLRVRFRPSTGWDPSRRWRGRCARPRRRSEGESPEPPRSSPLKNLLGVGAFNFMRPRRNGPP
jgi:hypothetical protein